MALVEITGSTSLLAPITGRYALGDRPRVLGVNVFACRLKSITPDGFVVAAPLVGEVGQTVSASFAPFGRLRGRIGRHVADGFAVEIDAGPTERELLGEKIEAYRNRAWTGTADKRAATRFMPGEPRSVLVLADGSVLPCLIVDYSATGAAVSADLTPAVGDRVTVGDVAGTVVRLFDVGFAISFDAVHDPEEIEQLLEAPEEWKDAVAVLKPTRIDTTDLEPELELVGYHD